MQSNLPILLKCTVFYSFAKRTKIKVPFDIMPSLLRAYINPKFSSLQIRKMAAIYCVPVYVAVPKQNTEYQYWKHTEVS